MSIEVGSALRVDLESKDSNRFSSARGGRLAVAGCGKLLGRGTECQGTTSLVPQGLQKERGLQP
jgi:hypothetical protein